MTSSGPRRPRPATTKASRPAPRALAEGETALVTALRAAGSDRVTVLLDGEPALTLTATAAVGLGLRRGVAVDAALWRTATGAAQAEAAEAAAARLLALRARTRAELWRRLAPRYPPAALQTALDHLQAIGAIDDEAFARLWLQARSGDRGLGRQALLAGLADAGVPAAVAKRLLPEPAPEEEAGAAVAVARAAARRYAGLPPATAARRLWAYLARRGFGSEATRAAVRAALGVEPGDDDPTPSGGDGSS